MRKLLLAAAMMLMLTGIGLSKDYPEWEAFGGFSMLNGNVNKANTVDMVGDTEGVSDILGGADLNKGFDFSFTRNVMPWLGFKANVTGHFGKIDTGATMDVPVALMDSPESTYNYSNKADYKRYSFLFGPEVSCRSNSKFRPFAHALVGFSRLTIGNINAANRYNDTMTIDEGDGYIFTETIDESTTLTGKAKNNTTFAMSLGGGVDLKAGKHVSIRLVELDYVPIYYNKLRADLTIKDSFKDTYTWESPDDAGSDTMEATATQSIKGNLIAPRWNNLKLSFGVVFSF
jgi:hypothetical protein